MSNRVFITGGRGFTGSCLFSLLQCNDWELWRYEGDILNYQDILRDIKYFRPSHLVHLAAISSVVHANAVDYHLVNVLGTRNVLRALVDSNLELNCVLLPSTSNVYGNKLEVISENNIPEPISDYAKSKLKMEILANHYTSKMPIVITRPFNYTGVGQSTSFIIPKLVRAFALKEKNVKLGNLYVQREYNDVRDVCRIYEMILNMDNSSKTINICSGVTYSLDNVIKLLNEITDHFIDVEIDQGLIRQNEIFKLNGDTSYLNSIIGNFNFIGLRETLHWMLKNYSYN